MYEVKLLKEAIHSIRARCVDDVVDKAHYFVTCGILALFCFIVSAKQIFGDPISCIAPAQFSKHWIAYVNNYCFVTSTYVNTLDDKLMTQNEETGRTRIDVSYYQWVPLVLAIQAVFFYAPHLFWFLFQKTQTDIDFKHIITKCTKSRLLDVKQQHEEIDDVVLDLVKTYEHRQVRENAAGLGSLGMTAYVAAKILNILNIVAQLFLLNLFIGHAGWGIEVISSAMKGAYWDHTGYFPRVSLCTFSKNAFANIQTHTVQCVLMMNMLNEKIYAILYVWFIVLLIASIVNAFYIFVCYISPLGQRRAVRRYLKAQSDKDRVDWRRFADLQLDHDGMLLLRFIENNAGLLIASEVACKFYDLLRLPAGQREIIDASTDDDKKKKVDKETAVTEEKPLL